MPPFVVSFLIKAAPYIAAFAVIFGAGVYTSHKAPFFGSDATVSRLTKDRDVQKAQALTNWRAWKAEKGAFDQSEALRGQEGSQAVRAVTQAVQACDARVATARRSTAAIAAITGKAPTYDANSCPVRELVDPGRLRDALGYPAPAG